MTASRTVSVGLAIGWCLAWAGMARAQSFVTLAPVLRPDRLGARGELDMAIDFAPGPSGVPAPIRRSVLRFPTGLALEVPMLGSCDPARLRALGPGGCPARSQVGRGRALVEVQLGSQTIAESVSLWIFLGPPANLQPTVEVLGQGYSPLDERVLLTGTLTSAGGAYGEMLTLSVPPIPTLPLEPDASIANLSLVIGSRAGRGANAVRVPGECPTGGFPFAAEFTYADGSSGSSLTTARCP